MVPHQGPREFLVRLQLGRLLRWTDRWNRGGFEGIGDPFLEGGLRSDHREFDSVALRPRDDALDVRHVPEEDVLRTTTNPWILVRHCGVDVGLTSTERFDDRMLAAPAPDDQHLHNCNSEKWRPGFLLSRTHAHVTVRMQRPLLSRTFPPPRWCSTTPRGVAGANRGRPISTRPTLTGWKQSPSLSGLTAETALSTEIWSGSGCWTRMPCTFGSLLNRPTSWRSRASGTSAGRSIVQWAIPISSEALPFIFT